VLLRLLDNNNRPWDPSEFIMAAEKYDRMRSVDRWIIDTFFAWAKKHNGQISDIEGFSLNLSGQSVMDATFRAYIIQHLRDGALPPAKIGFEITETAVVKNMEQVNQFISEIRQFGCKFYLDDFGSGYASYSYLKDLSVDCIKIDGVFIKDMLMDKSSYAMVKSITEIAHYTNKKVIAEYVESEALIIALRDIGVDYAQGFGVGMPQPLSTILQNTVAYG
jgi:EAL domain-containing protein (putative c-di-GMP-specific phosphodiesterase class I)